MNILLNMALIILFTFYHKIGKNNQGKSMWSCLVVSVILDD